MTTVSVACSALATPANAGEATDEAPPASHAQRTTWQELDERAREAYADQAWLEAARGWEFAARTLAALENPQPSELEALAELSIHAALAYTKTDLRWSGVAILEVAERRLAEEEGGRIHPQVSHLRARVTTTMEAMQVGLRPPAPIPTLERSGPVARASAGPDLDAVGMIYGGSAVLVLGVAAGALAGYGATLELRNTSNRTRNGDRPHAHTFLGVGLAGVATLVPAGTTTLALGLRKLKHGGSRVSLSPSRRGVVVSGRF